jgi:hypothetical protein
MYFFTAGTFDALTANELNPSCQAHLIPCWFIHREEFDFNRLTALDTDMLGVNSTSA